MSMYAVGSKMNDPVGNLWTITSIWQFENYLCMSLMTADGVKVGGHRIQLYQMT